MSIDSIYSSLLSIPSINTLFNTWYYDFYNSFINFNIPFTNIIIHPYTLMIFYSSNIIYLLFGLFYFLLDIINIDFINSRRLQPKPKCSRTSYDMLSALGSELLPQYFIVLPISQFIISPLFEYVQICNFGDLPNWDTLFMQVLFCALINDFFFYFLHRLFHSPSLYFLHKQHHSFTAPFAWSAQYASIPELILVDIAPIAIGPLLLGKSLHFFTFLVWVSLRLIYTCEIHSGYDLWIWRLIPFYGGYIFIIYFIMDFF